SPRFDGYDIAGQSIPAKDVGGDYYDFIKVDESQLAICLGDVSGKGIPAALLMSNLQATLRGQTMMLESGPRECIGRSNQLIFRSTDLDKFATLFYGIIDNKSNNLIYTNAGHDIPFLLRADRECSRLMTGGIVVGFVEKYSYDQERVSFDLGDVLILYSDGLTEAMNEDEEEFGEQRLYEVVQKNRNLSAAELIQVIMKNIYEFSSESTQMDDMTVVVVRRTG
ncbi:MAG: PP2C family protein-serine/threonine phosphatase, partial [Calditrichaceae bacterium]